MNEPTIPSQPKAVQLATELDREAQLSLQAVKAANLIERMGLLEIKVIDMETHIKKLEGRLVTYVVLEKEGE